MTLEQTDVIDIAGIDKESGDLILTVTDAWGWASEEQSEHLRLLEAKLNTYIAAVESGEVFQRFADITGKSVGERRTAISVRFLNAPASIGLHFLAHAAVILDAAGIGFEARVDADDQIRMGQRSICARFGVEPNYPKLWEKVGIARNWSPVDHPISGLRHQPAAGTCGWYLWSGVELSSDPDYFVPLHFAHLNRGPTWYFPIWRYRTGGGFFWRRAMKMSGTTRIWMAEVSHLVVLPVHGTFCTKS